MWMSTTSRGAWLVRNCYLLDHLSLSSCYTVFFSLQHSECSGFSLAGLFFFLPDSAAHPATIAPQLYPSTPTHKSHSSSSDKSLSLSHTHPTYMHCCSHIYIRHLHALRTTPTHIVQSPSCCSCRLPERVCNNSLLNVNLREPF